MVLPTHSGSWSDNRLNQMENTLPWITAGPGIARNISIDRPLSLLDLAPTFAHLLKMAPHPCWCGRNVQEIFATSGEQTAASEAEHRRIHLLKMDKIRPAA